MSDDYTGPPLSSWGERLRERTEPLAPDDGDHGYAHARLAEALSKIFERVGPIYDPDDGLPGQALVDVDACPDWALPWLAQLVGVALPPGSSADTSRDLIRDVAGWRRGTPAAMRAAAAMHLTGDKTIIFRERDPDAADPPYSLEIVTRTGETPDPAAVLAELLRQKPAGIVLDYHTIVGLDWQEAVAGYATWTALDAAFTTWNGVVYNAPGT